MKKIWFSIFDFSFSYKGPEPPFAEPSQFNWAKDFEKEADSIKKELQAYLTANNLQSYFNSSMVSKPNSWKTIALKTWSIELFKNQIKFPLTTALLNKYPQIISASFNLLTPNSKIHPHCGDTNAIYRCHLGLVIPAGLPDCGIKVNCQDKAWEQNKWLIFMDAYVHEAWNDTDKERYIFLIDVLRDEFTSEKSKVCSTVLTSLFLQKRAEKFKFLLNTKPFFVKFLVILLKPLAQFAIFTSNKLRIY